MHFKKYLCIILVLVLLSTVAPTVVMATSTGSGKLGGWQEGKMSVSFETVTVSDSGPALAPGNHELWIDRIDQLPDYAASFYTWMEANVQKGGALIDPTQLTPIKGDTGKYDTYIQSAYSLQGTVNFTYTGTAHESAAQQAILAQISNIPSVVIQYLTAVYGAFDRDHPEVFWLNGQSMYGYDIPYNYTYNKTYKTGTATYTLEIFFLLKNSGFDVRNPQYQSALAIETAMDQQAAAVETILQDCPQDSAYEQVRYINNTLTHINAYNSAVALDQTSQASLDAWKGISALTGRSGADGPVCEGYARAMMILCRELGIPCVLAEGDARLSVDESLGAHMWNYVQVEGDWYAVDTTWNDPYVTGNGTAIVSGHESEDWLLLGTQSVRLGMTFETSHVLTNHTTTNSLLYTNGPVLAESAYEPPDQTVVPTLTLKAPTLEFKDMITVNAMFEASDLEDVVQMGMITYSTKVDTWSVETAENVIPGTTYDESTGRYIATSQGIHAKYLGDTVYLAVYAELTDGTYVYSKLAGYSPVQYATSKLKGTDVPLKQLVVAMLNYGAAAQIHFGHNVENLANGTLTAEQMALPEAYRSDMVSTVASPSAEKQGEFANNKGFSKRYPSISFEGAFCINYFFTPAYVPVDEITLYYWNAADYEAVEVLAAENASGFLTMEIRENGEYRGDIAGIAAKALGEGVYVAAVYSDGTTTWTSGVLGYSIGAYCSSQATKGGTIADLAMTTAVYGYQAKQYFG